MSLDALIMLLGALVAVMPFLGFTVAMQMWIFFILGIIIIGLGIAVRRRGQKQRSVRPRKGEFVESIPSDTLYDSEVDHHMHSPDGGHMVA